MRAWEQSFRRLGEVGLPPPLHQPTKPRVNILMYPRPTKAQPLPTSLEENHKMCRTMQNNSTKIDPILCMPQTKNACPTSKFCKRARACHSMSSTLINVTEHNTTELCRRSLPVITKAKLWANIVEIVSAVWRNKASMRSRTCKFLSPWPKSNDSGTWNTWR